MTVSLGPVNPHRTLKRGAGFLIGTCVLLQSAAAGAQPPRGCASVRSSAATPRQSGEERALSDILAEAAEVDRAPSGCNTVYTGSIDLPERSIEIVRLATRGDPKALEPLISPRADFTVRHGDYATGRQKGASGAVEFAKRLGATDFLHVDPYSMARSTGCGNGDVSIQLYGDDPERAHSENRAYIATFKYRNGCLAEVTAIEGVLFRGKIGRD